MIRSPDMESLVIELGLVWDNLHLDLSTVRVDSSLESYHRFLGFDGFSDFFGDLDESVLFTNSTVSMTASLKIYAYSHKSNP